MLGFNFGIKQPRLVTNAPCIKEWRCFLNIKRQRHRIIVLDYLPKQIPFDVKGKIVWDSGGQNWNSKCFERNSYKSLEFLRINTVLIPIIYDTFCEYMERSSLVVLRMMDNLWDRKSLRKECLKIEYRLWQCTNHTLETKQTMLIYIIIEIVSNHMLASLTKNCFKLISMIKNNTWTAVDLFCSLWFCSDTVLKCLTDADAIVALHNVVPSLCGTYVPVMNVPACKLTYVYWKMMIYLSRKGNKCTYSE